MRVALYPGTFDPITNGHVSLIRRGLQVFDHVIVAVADRTPKPALFSQAERVEMVREAVGDLPDVEVVPFTGLTVEYAAARGACAILRGMRAVSDFELEFQQALMNRRLNGSVETVFFMTDYQWLFISSTIVKNAAFSGASISGLVPEHVQRRLEEACGQGEAPREAKKKSGTRSTHMAHTSCEPRIAIYPGTFDPITNGHLSIIRRSLTVFDKVIVAVAENAGKNPLFSLEDRVGFVRRVLADQGDRVEVRSYHNLTVDFGRQYYACAIVRGLRATGDFEYEFQLALMNRRLNRTIQSVFFMTDYQWLYVSSSIIKAAASHGGSIDGLVPDIVRDSLLELYRKGRMHHSTPCLGTPPQGFPKKATQTGAKTGDTAHD